MRLSLECALARLTTDMRRGSAVDKGSMLAASRGWCSALWIIMLAVSATMALSGHAVAMTQSTMGLVDQMAAVAMCPSAIDLCVQKGTLKRAPRTYHRGPSFTMPQRGDPRKNFASRRRVAQHVAQRTPAAHIGSVMALMATFDEVGVLPPEQMPEANQLIHTLIQLQSTVLKSRDEGVRTFVSNALRTALSRDAPVREETLVDTGLTMAAVEALVDHAVRADVATLDSWERGLAAYNVQRRDWALLDRLVRRARQQAAMAGESLTDIFERRRAEMARGRVQPRR